MKQTTKEKANELLDNYWLMEKINPSLSKEQAKQFALIAVDEILFVLEFNLDFKMEKSIKYWQEVKNEIQNL